MHCSKYLFLGSNILNLHRNLLFIYAIKLPVHPIVPPNISFIYVFIFIHSFHLFCHALETSQGSFIHPFFHPILQLIHSPRRTFISLWNPCSYSSTRFAHPISLLFIYAIQLPVHAIVPPNIPSIYLCHSTTCSPNCPTQYFF